MRRSRRGVGVTVLCAALLLAGGCAAGRPDDTHPRLPESAHSELLRMQTSDPRFTIAEIISASDSTKVSDRYLLFTDKAGDAVRDSLAAVYPDARQFDIPLRNILVYSSVQGRAFVELGAPEAVGAIVDRQYFNVPELNERIRSGEIADCGAASSPSKEKVLAARPSAILLSLYEGMDVGGVDKSGVPVIRLVDNLESTPLGRAEWLRFLGALTGRQAEADSIFAAVTREYTRIRTESATIGKKPVVLTDNIYQGVWYLPAGESFAARLIADAGGDYPWKDTRGTGSLNCSLEEVLERGRDADVWILRQFGKELTISSILAEDGRYAHLRPLDSGQVWYANTAETPVFEEANYHPERILADYARIFRAVSEAVEPDSLLYFKRIGR